MEPGACFLVKDSFAARVLPEFLVVAVEPKLEQPKEAETRLSTARSTARSASSFLGRDPSPALSSVEALRDTVIDKTLQEIIGSLGWPSGPDATEQQSEKVRLLLEPA